MRLFFDVDGVLLNFERAFVKWLNENWGMTLPADYQTASWYFDDLLDEEECRRAWQTFLGSEDAARMEPYLAPARFNSLTASRPVHLLTNFPERYMDKRVENLSSIGFKYHSLHHCGFSAFRPEGIPRKSEIVTRLLRPGEAGLFVDDHPDNCTDVVRNCPDVEVWLMSRRFNRDFDHPQVRRAPDWESVIDRLRGPAGPELGAPRG